MRRYLIFYRVEEEVWQSCASSADTETSIRYSKEKRVNLTKRVVCREAVS